MIRVEVTRGESVGTALEPTTDVVRIGRAEGNDLVVLDTHVSSEHAKIVFAGERYVLVDQRSTNGTAILRIRVKSPASLRLRTGRMCRQPTLAWP